MKQLALQITKKGRRKPAALEAFWDSWAAYSAACFRGGPGAPATGHVAWGDSLIGLPTEMYLPRVGWSTSTTVPVVRSDWSSAISFIDRIGPQGMSSLLRISIASNLVLVMVQSSMRAKISLRRDKRAGV